MSENVEIITDSTNEISVDHTGEFTTGAEGPAENRTDDYEPLFPDEARPTEAELMGEESEPEPEPEIAQEPEEKPQEAINENAATPQPEEEDKAGEKEQAESEEPKEVKPPEGFVPFAALREERTKRQDQNREIAELKSQISELLDMVSKPQQPQSNESEFKLLSQKDFDALIEDDPVAAIKYLDQKDTYLREQDEHGRESKIVEERARRDEQIVDKAFERLHKNIPDLFENGSDTAAKLSTFAAEHGLSTDHLAALGDPRTLILPAGADEPTPLGERAAALIEFINGVSKTISENTPEKLRSQVESELRKNITDEVTKELTKKLKSNPTDFRSIGNTPTQPDNPDASRDYSEAEWARLPKEKREALLMAM